MGIERQIKFDFLRGEKVETLKKFNIIASEENLEKMEKREDGWYMDGVSIEEINNLYNEKDEYWK